MAELYDWLGEPVAAGRTGRGASPGIATALGFDALEARSGRPSSESATPAPILFHLDTKPSPEVDARVRDWSRSCERRREPEERSAGKDPA
jgi:hypothetical protein